MAARCEHAVATVTGLGWAGTKNGELLHLAADQGFFKAFVTLDVGLHVAPDISLRVLMLRADCNRLEALLPLMPSVLEHLAALVVVPRSSLRDRRA